MRALLPLAAALILIGAAPAAAHSITPGTSGFTDGLQHPFGIPAHVMILLAAGLLLGQRDVGRWAAPLYGFLAGFALGLALGPLLTDPPLERAAAVALLALAAVSGVMIAWARPWHTALLAPLLALAGFALGFDSAPDGSLQQTLAALAGTGFAAIFALLNLAMLANYVRMDARPWRAIGLRVVGSWIAAAAIMVLALELRPL
ncbi:MAG: HupE/UreJ family protein [Alphaproteobacteria bacterium]